MLSGLVPFRVGSCYIAAAAGKKPAGAVQLPQYHFCSIIVSDYHQEIPQSLTADKHMAPRGRAMQLA